MLGFPLLLALSTPSARAACTISALSPAPDTTLTARRNFTFLMTTECVSSTFRVTGVSGTKTPVYSRMVTGKQMMVVTPTAANWAAWTASSNATIPWRVTATDAAGVTTSQAAVAQLDLDADGWTRKAGDTGTCDASAAQNPGATEICDGIDNNCNGVTDDGAGTVWYSDEDADGYGDPGAVFTSCVQPSGTTGSPDDCNDADIDVHPDAEEIACDGEDQDCDGSDTGSVLTWTGNLEAPGSGETDSGVYSYVDLSHLIGIPVTVTMALGGGESYSSMAVYSPGTPIPETVSTSQVAHIYDQPSGTVMSVGFTPTEAGEYVVEAIGNWGSREGATNTFQIDLNAACY